MVLSDYDEPSEPARLARADNLVGVEFRGIQQRWILVAIAPFAVGICIEPPVDDAVDLAVAGGNARGQRRARLRRRAKVDGQRHNGVRRHQKRHRHDH